MRLNSIATLIVLILTTRTGEAAQTPAPAAISEHQAAFHDLRDSQWVRLVTPALARQEGRLLAHENDTLMLDRGSDSLLRIRVMDVDSLWVRGSSWKTGAIVGSVLGGVGGAILGGFFADLCSADSSDCPSTVAGAVGGGLGGVLAGGLVGGVFGSAVPKWHSRWP